MSAATASTFAAKPLTQEEVFALAARVHEDPTAVDELVVALVGQAVQARRAEFLARENALLEHRLALFLKRYFGQSSEKLDPAQLLLFLQEAGGAAPETESPASAPESSAARRKPAGHGRGAFPAHVKRERIALDPPKQERTCAVCNAELRRIRDEITERGSYVPGYWLVNAYVRGVWACGSGCAKPVMAPLPPALVEKSRFEPDVAVHTALAKYGDHLPLQRQTDIHARLGVDVPASTLGDAVQALAALHAPTVAQMRDEVAAEKVVHADDTPVIALLDRPEAQPHEKKKERVETRVWVYRSALKPKMCFDFTESRARGGPTKALRGFKGTLVADAAPSFNEVCRVTGSKRAGCYAHVRRKFHDARGSDPPRSARPLLLLHRLFRLEAAAKRRQEDDPSFGADALLALRRRRSVRVVERFFALLEKLRTEVLPKSPLGEAVSYALNQREALRVFLDDPDVPVDNNAAERALRGVALGRKNYLFFGSLRGGDAAAIFYSLLGTCRALELNPYAYLRETTELLLKNPATPRVELTPWAWAEARRAKLAASAPAPAPPEP